MSNILDRGWGRKGHEEETGLWKGFWEDIPGKKSA